MTDLRRPPRPPVTCKDCGGRYPTGQQGGHCTVCHESFSSNTVFDLHRVGRFEPMERRCLTVEEMQTRGWVQREHGYWGRPGSRPASDKGDPDA